MKAQAQSRTKPSVPSITPVPSALLQRKCACGSSPGASGECEDCQKKRLDLQRKEAGAGGPGTAPPIVHEVLSSPGQHLGGETLSFMESRFGHSLSRVRVHTDARAQESARAVDALAYTAGSSIVFGERQFQPQSAQGRRLLAHELTHVIQQSSSAEISPDLTVRSPGTAEEREADVAAANIDKPGHAGIAARLPWPDIQREPTHPRGFTGTGVLSDLSTQTAKPGMNVSAGSLARQEWESLFRRHFTEPDKVLDEVESSHARYFYSRIYGWIDAQHFFAHIQFAEDKGLDAATAEGIGIEKKQQIVRDQIGPDKDDPTAYSLLLESNLITPEDFIHYRETMFMALAAALDVVLDPQQRALVKGFNEHDQAKLILDNAMSAWSYEDLASNQLGVQFFRLHGSFVNAGTDAVDIRQRFIDRMTAFFADIQVVDSPAEVKKLAAKLPGKERWTAPKMSEEKARKKFPELFRFDDFTHRVRIAIYDQEDVAHQKEEEVKKLVKTPLSLTLESYGKSRFALYTGATSHFGAVVFKWAIDSAIPTGKGGSLVEPLPPTPPKKTIYGPEP